jgi:hypothetical protein
MITNSQSSATGLRNKGEAELLIACSRSTVDVVTQQRIRTLVNSGPDWHQLIDLSKLHGTAPLLYRTLSTICPDVVPQELLRSLQHHYCAVVVHNARMATALVEIVGILHKCAIPVRPLKGPAVAALAYGDITLREFGDLDLLIRKRDLAAAIDALTAEKFVYSRSDGADGLPQAERKYHQLQRTGDRFFIDLQWMIAHDDFSFSLEHESFWQRTRVLEVAGGQIETLSPEATLLVLCIHGAKHLWSHLKWTCDVAELLRRHPHLDWEWTVRTSSDLGCRRMLLLGLLMARDVLDATVPNEILDQIGKDAVVEGLALRLLGRLRDGEDPHDETRFSGAEYLLLRSSLRDRIWFLVYLCIAISPGDDARLNAFPASFRVLYYALLPLRTIGRRLPVPRLKTAVSEWLERMGSGI